MKGSFKIATVAGIGIFVHWTFFLLLVWIAYLHAAAGDNLALALEGIGFILALFACVVLHELGHSLTAQRFGVQTRDITLLPIGGVARLERIPENPLQEFWIAVAGPAVNVVIAVVLLAVTQTIGDVGRVEDMGIVGGAFLTKLMWVNVGLVIFNMIPAFPMDGGRVLRAVLATQMSRVKATHLAAAVGQAIAIFFAVSGVFSGQWMLVFIALFVYQGAQAEAHAVEIRSLLKGLRVRDAMVTHFQTLSVDDPLEAAITASSEGLQKDFPVTDNREITGIVLYRDVVRALAEKTPEARVAEIMRRDCVIMHDNEPLQRALERMQSSGCGTLLVEHNDELVGILSEEHLGQWLALHSSLLTHAGK